MKTYAKTQPELAEELTSRMGVNISARTVKRHIERARDAGWKGACPPRPLPDGRLEIEGWIVYLKEIDFKAIESDDALPDRPNGSVPAATKKKPLSEYVSHILRSPSEADRHERTVEALIAMIDGMRKLSFPPAPKAKGTAKCQKPAPAPSRGGSSYSRMLAVLHAKSADMLDHLDRLPAGDHEERAIELEALIFGTAADSIVLDDGRTVAEAIASLPEK